MKITLKQHGGLGGRRAPVILDTTDLAGERADVERLARLVAGQAQVGGAPHPDELAYTLVIADAAAIQEARGMDSTATPEFSTLVQQVRARGKAAPG